MAKLTNYEAIKQFNADSILITDGSSGTKKILAEDAAADFAGRISPINRRNVYRGKNLGTAVTPEQWAAISAGTFDDLFIGDYWTINGHRYDIADMNYWYNSGDISFRENHLVMIPRGNMYNHVMNDANTVTGAYVGSKLYTEGLDAAKEQIGTDFGSHLKTHRQYLVNAVDSNGTPTGAAWYDSQVDLMNEINVYGCHIKGAGYNTVDTSQFALFRLNPQAAFIGYNFWLRDVVPSRYFAIAHYTGAGWHANTTFSHGVRPAFAIG